MLEKNCPICDKSASINWIGPLNQKANVECGLCGNYSIETFAADTTLKDHEFIGYLYLLSGYIRNQTEKGKDIHLTTDEIQNILKQTPLNVEEKIDRIMLFLLNKTDEFGKKIQLLPDSMYSVAYCKSAAEFTRLLHALVERNYIKLNNADGMTALTLNGLEFTRKMQEKSSASNVCFIAIDFDDKYDEVYKSAILLALSETKYIPVCLKTHEHNNLIDDEMINKIKQSQFVIAEISSNNAGVCFEAGFAIGLGIPVIFICEKEKMNDRHFDVEHFNTILYENNAQLKKKLANRIGATIG